MTNGNGDANSGAGAGDGGGYHRVQAERDLQSNWEVDLAHKLEDYLLKICSGEILDDSEGQIPINFAEAALLLQGSVQVYSRKVEYLHSLVLRALEFLSRKSQEEQLEGTSEQPEDNNASASRDVGGEESESFWDLDDIPVDPKNCLDVRSNEDSISKNFVKPPANLVVLEGDCLDSGGDAGELESYLLATSDLYRGFILLDPCDSLAVNDYLDADKCGKGQTNNNNNNENSAYKGSTGRKSFQSPTSYNRSSVKKSRDGKAFRTPLADDKNIGLDDPAPDLFHDVNDGFDPTNDFDDGDDDDPWKPLNPHEPGSLKAKPFRKVNARKKTGVASSKRVLLSSLFPPARFHGPVSVELRAIWEMRNHAHEKRKRRRDSDSLPLYEKLRQQLVNDSDKVFEDYLDPKSGNDEDEAHNKVPDFDQPDDNAHEFMDEDVPFRDEQNDKFGVGDPFGFEDANSQANLEDLCRSHLDALLANIAETEKQSELASRVTTWKQKIETNLDEQESHPEFDIHRYGEKVLDKLSLETEDHALSFSEVVRGEVKYDIARTFSALLQLVNNGDVELDRNGAGASVCFTAENPFHVRLLRNEERPESQFQFPKKRLKISPAKKASRKRSEDGDEERGVKFPVKVGKIGVVRCTPEGKKRRRSRLVDSS